MRQIKTVCSNCGKLIPSVAAICLSCAYNKGNHSKFIGLSENAISAFDRVNPIKFCVGEQVISLDISEAKRIKKELEIIIKRLV